MLGQGILAGLVTTRFSLMTPGPLRWILETIQFPSILSPEDSLLSTIYNGKVNSGLTFEHTASTNVYQEYYRRQDDIQNKGKANYAGYHPFEESRLYVDKSKEFYLTGTSIGVLPGFDAPLSQKVIFAFDVPISDTEIGSTTNLNFKTDGSGDLDGTPRPYMRYVNFETNNLDQKGGIFPAGFYVTSPKVPNTAAAQRNVRNFFRSSSIAFGPLAGGYNALMFFPNILSGGIYDSPSTTGTARYSDYHRVPFPIWGRI